MRWNSNEILDYSHQVPDWEGKMSFKSVLAGVSDPGGGFKERYFKLKGNLLFYSREGQDPLGLIVLENVASVQREIKEASMFSITFLCQKKLIFWVARSRSVEPWVDILSKASYEHQRHLLADLRLRISQRTGRDPLRGTMFEKRSLKAPAQPSPPPRSKNKKAHLPNNSPLGRPKASFKSHIDPNQDLIQF
uniref:Pleckstrin homology domain-containing family J member 1 n=1 Tax=Caligus rogercresseyi TaxID=217165 RepID=C1BQR9_CALRO|nr:Pleckstrin homology domain-containing family J member 1 [Caligus rogercresseyi]